MERSRTLAPLALASFLHSRPGHRQPRSVPDLAAATSSSPSRPAPEANARAIPPADAPALRPSALADLRASIAEVWQWRELLRQLTLRDLRVRYKQAVLGLFWAVLMPALIVLAGVVVRLAVAHATGHALDVRAVGAVAVKALPWAFFSGALGAATPSLTNNASLLGKVYFPREVIPLGALIAQAIDIAIGTLVLALALPWLGGRLTGALVWLPLLAALLVLLTLAAALAASAANLFFRDVRYLVQVVLTFGVFFTPVFFEPSSFGPLGRRLLWLNPIAPLVEGARLVVIEGHGLTRTIDGTGGGAPVWSPWLLAYSAAWAVLGCAVAAVVFRRLQPIFAERV